MEVKDKIIEILSLHSEMENVDQYLHDNDDISKLNLNSITFIKMVIDLEQEFGFEFEDEDLVYSNFTSLVFLCDYVKDQMEKNNVIYSLNNSTQEADVLRKEIIQIVSKYSSNAMLHKTAFNNIYDLNLSELECNGLISDINAKYGLELDIGQIIRNNCFMINNLCRYICNNMV